MKVIDLTHVFNNEMPVYPGDPKPEVRQIAWLEKQGYNDFRLTTGMHVGTHIDAPLHMIEGGKLISDFPVEKLVGPGYIIDARGQSVIDESFITPPLKPGAIVLVFTGFSQKFTEIEYFEIYPELSESFAKKLIDAKVSMLGIDFASPDKDPYPIHKLLLGQEILIVENLTNLEKLLSFKKFSVSALPLNLEAEASPARVLATIND